MFRRLSLYSFFVMILGCVSSLSAMAQSEDLAPGRRRTVVVRGDLTQDTVFSKPYTYIISGEIHVQHGVTLTIEDGVLVLIRNGDISGRLLKKSALLFDPGSRLKAESVTFRAADAFDRIQRRADNGGIWFLGTYRGAEKDGVPVVKVPGAPKSNFTAKHIFVSYLGCGDPPEGPDDSDVDAPSVEDEVDRGNNDGDDDDDPNGDDLDGFSILGVGKGEWNVESVQSEFSGDDGFDVTNSRLRMKSLKVKSPREDGLNISSSRVEVEEDIQVTMTKRRGRDRELFDLEVDDGPSYAVFLRNCKVLLQGHFGDEVKLKSNDLPTPDPLHKDLYDFRGVTVSGSTFVYSIDED